VRALPSTGTGGYESGSGLYVGLALMVGGASISLMAMRRRRAE
jgi:hypothetical protein